MYDSISVLFTENQTHLEPKVFELNLLEIRVHSLW